MSRLIVFDLDGTLVNTAINIIKSLNIVFDEIGYEKFDTDKVIEVIGKGSHSIITTALNTTGDNRKRRDVSLAELIFRLEQTYSQMPTENWHMYDGALDAMDKLRIDGKKLAICTNKPQVLAENVINDLKLDGYFETIIGGDIKPYKKPDHRHLLDTIEESGFSSTDSIFVGDANTDMIVAQKAGVPGIWFASGYEALERENSKHVYEMKYFRQLTKIIEEIDRNNSDF